MLTNETVKNLDGTVQVVCEEIKESIKKGGGSNPDLINALANLINTLKN